MKMRQSCFQTSADFDISKKVIFPYESFTLDELKSACRAKDASDQGDADALQKMFNQLHIFGHFESF